MLEILQEASHFLVVRGSEELWVVGGLAFLFFPPLNVSEVSSHCDNPESPLEALAPPLYSSYDSYIQMI